MAKSHLIQYFLEVENSYLDLVANLPELRELNAEGKIDNDSLAELICDIEKAKENYARIGYIMFLLNKPNRASKKLTRDEQSWYDALQFASKEAILDESKDVLCKMKELITEGEFKNEG